MAREQFGITWWGAEWLKALSNIDLTNRLPRGLSYARRGMVKDFMIKDGMITSTVAGSRPSPYEVTLSMDKFSHSQMSILMDDIIKYPTILSRLLNGKMDPLLVKIAQESKMKIFPLESSDMNMYCSCPDYAVPCKHIAATIYKVCTEIDNNPFVLFKFRDTDLIGLLKERGIDVMAIYNESVMSYKSFIQENELASENTASQRWPDFSQLKDKSISLFQLIEDNPVFYKYGNFKKNYTNVLTKISREVQKALSEKNDLGYFLNEDLRSNLNTDVELKANWINNKLVLSTFNYSTIFSLTNKALENVHPSIKHQSLLLRLALTCIAKGLVSPKLLEKQDGFIVLWLPTRLDNELVEIMGCIGTEYGIIKNGKKLNVFLSLGLIITFLIRKFYRLLASSDPIENLFFNEDNLDLLEDTSVAGSINRWLQLYYFDLGAFYPLLEINEGVNDTFNIDIRIGEKDKNLKKPIDLKTFIDKTKNKSKLFDFIKDLDLLSHYLEEIGIYLNNQGVVPMVFNKLTFPRFLFEISPIMNLLGIKVVLPKSLKSLIKPKASVSLDTESGSSSGVLGLANILRFDWQVSLGTDLVSVDDFKKILTDAGQMIKYKGQYIYIDESDLLKLNKHLEKNQNISNVELLRIALSEDYNGAPIRLSSKVQTLIKELTDIKLINQPAKLQATLRPYQLRGFSWLVKNTKIGVGSILADDMGLGKTIQVIAFLCHLKDVGALDKMKVIIIVPTSLIPNWESEMTKFAPHLNKFTYYGPNRNIKDINDHDIILTTYGNLRSDVTKLKKVKWLLSVIDESQNIKNPNSQQTKAVKSLKAMHNIAMSGTPVENRLMDYWSVMDFVNSGLLGNKTSFNKLFDKPISKDRNRTVLAKFNKITAPFIMRRMKTDKSIISDLPDKIVMDVYSKLTVTQTALYQKVVDEAMSLIEGVDYDDSKNLFKRSGLVLQMILALKQICNHPAQWLKDDKIDPSLSGKTALMLDTVESILEAGEKVLIFTQFKHMGDIIEESIKNHFGITPLWFHGGVPLKKRREMVDDFQNLSHKRVMVLSLKAAGTGLNLTAANHVIHYDLWWNPAVEAQATDRAFRIGQKKNVMVHRFITKDTFEEKINDLINSKKELADLAVSVGEKWIGEMSDKEIGQMFKMD